MPSQEVTVNARKYDQSIRKSWTCDLVERTGQKVVLRGVFDEAVKHAGLGDIKRGTVSYEYYWLDRWYNIFRFHEPDGAFRNFYCNISMPATLADGILDYVDLEIDIIVWKGFEYEIHDLDDFEVNAARYSYPEHVISKAKATIDELCELIERREFPFNAEART